MCRIEILFMGVSQTTGARLEVEDQLVYGQFRDTM